MITVVQGVIHTPNYPESYDMADCIWTIRSDYNHVVELDILDFELEDHPNCTYDYLRVSLF